MQTRRYRLAGALAAGVLALAWACSWHGRPARASQDHLGPAHTTADTPGQKPPQTPRAPRVVRRRVTPSVRRRPRPPKLHSKNHASVRGAFTSIASSSARSTVAILCDGKQVALGAVVDAAGYVVTKASELASGARCRFRDGTSAAAAVVAKDDRNDLALLKVSAKGLKPIAWADDDDPAVGSWVITPGLDDVPVSIGVVSVARRKGRSARRPNRGFLGISFPQTGSDARVGQVIPRTGAARAGLKVNDVIVKVDDKPVANRNALLSLLSKTKAKQKVTLRIRRGGKELDVSATLGLFPTGRFNPQQYVGGALSERRSGFESIIQHDSTLLPNQCGGAALDVDGKAVGINISRAGRVESYILPASLAKKLIARLKAAAAKPADAGKKK